ncbi:MAG: hypothetical protein OEW19_21880 [Acidobacteriota bacterium]|nr:hypothetical protein [Acidobacteriota bacterium]
MLLKAGFIVIAGAILAWVWMALGRATAACGDPPSVAGRMRRRFMLVAAGWVGLALLMAQTGVLRQWDRRPPPLVFLLVSIVGLGVIVARSRAGDRLSRGVSLAGLVGLQAFRLPLEVLMHQAAVEGVMPVQMSYSGWNFDVLTGLTAIGLAVWLQVGRPPRRLVWIWNVLGLALLANIVTIAVASSPIVAWFGSTPDRLNTFVTYPPYVLLPAVMVLAAWAGHLLIFRALGAGRRLGA